MTTRIGFIVAGLLFSSGCGSLWSHERDRTPVAPTAPSSDLIFVRTGDRAYYYIVDKQRGLCFFHSTLYGKKHLVELDCEKLPEYRDILRRAGVKHPPKRVAISPPPKPKTMRDHGRLIRPKTDAPQVYTPRSPPAEPDVSEHDHTGLSDEDRNAFRRAWVQRFCSRRAGSDEPLDVVLTRHGLDMERWDLAKREFSADRDLWSALTSEAMETCP